MPPASALRVRRPLARWDGGVAAQAVLAAARARRPLVEGSGEVLGTGCVFSKAPSEKVDTMMSPAPVSDSTVGYCAMHSSQTASEICNARMQEAAQAEQARVEWAVGACSTTESAPPQR